MNMEDNLLADAMLMVCFVRTEARNLTVSGMASTQGRLRSLGIYAVTAARFEESGRSLN
jgi:hypothetical protein